MRTLAAFAVLLSVPMIGAGLILLAWGRQGIHERTDDYGLCLSLLGIGVFLAGCVYLMWIDSKKR